MGNTVTYCRTSLSWPKGVQEDVYLTEVFQHRYLILLLLSILNNYFRKDCLSLIGITWASWAAQLWYMHRGSTVQSWASYSAAQNISILQVEHSTQYFNEIGCLTNFCVLYSTSKYFFKNAFLQHSGFTHTKVSPDTSTAFEFMLEVRNPYKP